MTNAVTPGDDGCSGYRAAAKDLKPAIQRRCAIFRRAMIVAMPFNLLMIVWIALTGALMWRLADRIK